MEALFAVAGLAIALVLILSVVLARRWKKGGQDAGSDGSSQAMWSLVQQQMDQLRAQVSDSQSKTLSLLTEQLRVIQEQVHQQLQSVNHHLQNSSGQIGQRLDNTTRIIGEVRENIGKLSKTSEQIYEVGKNIASLQDILRPPKLRGGLGEHFLGELLSQILPPECFTLQYPFSSGERVDAVVQLGEKLVPIDSKFPLENFRRILESKTEEERRGHHRSFSRDVKKHIDHIASKYIVPEEGTYDFALLYIPAENVYYETITKDESLGDENPILTHALAKKVIPVSPNSFYAYLQVIMMGLRGLRIEDHARDIQTLLVGLGKDLKEFQEDFRVVGKHIGDARNRFEEARGRLERFSLKLDQVESRPLIPAAGHEE